MSNCEDLWAKEKCERLRDEKVEFMDTWLNGKKYDGKKDVRN